MRPSLCRRQVHLVAHCFNHTVALSSFVPYSAHLTRIKRDATVLQLVRGSWILRSSPIRGESVFRVRSVQGKMEATSLN
jgi:hypothetical protein